MKLIFTTYSGVYVLNTETRALNCIHKGSGMYYGLTWNKKNLYVAARNSVEDYRLGNEKILVFDQKLQHVGELSHTFKDCGLHSILTIPDKNQLWVTCPLKNKIIIVDLSANTASSYFPDPSAKSGDKNHFNSLALDQDGKVLINVHNNGRAASEIWVCDPNLMDITKKIKMPGSSHSHCCWQDGDDYWTCASEESQVRSDSGKNLLPKKLSGYTRGVVLTKDRVIVGESQRQVREKRAKADGLIHIYERGTMKHVTTFNWQGIGQIAEVRVLDIDDEHHWPKPFHGTK